MIFRNCTNLIAHVFTVQTAAGRIKSGTAQSIPTIFCFASGGFCVEICSHRLWAWSPTSSAPPPEECESAYSWQDRPYQDQAGCPDRLHHFLSQRLAGADVLAALGVRGARTAGQGEKRQQRGQHQRDFFIGKTSFPSGCPEYTRGEIKSVLRRGASRFGANTPRRRQKAAASTTGSGS